MSVQYLITGGAGFLGSHLADQLLDQGDRVRILDSLVAQVHGEGAKRPAYLNPEVELRIGDVRDPQAVRAALQGVDRVFHFAAAVGVGQSMYRMAEYTAVNNLGTAVLAEALVDHPVQRLVVASSMSVYGEGLYRDAQQRVRTVGTRSRERLAAGRWDWEDEQGNPLEPLPTPEHKTPALASVYALSKYDQERLCLIVGDAYRIPTVALRFFNAYGARQSLSNPYTGVLAIFAARLLNGRPPMIYEDGRQLRDFVAAEDVARACRLARTSPRAPGGVFNVGSGEAVTVRSIAERTAVALGVPEIEPQISGRWRSGDIRHCFADLERARTELGYAPQVSLEHGIARLAQWLSSQPALDRIAEAGAELERRGLTA